MQKAATQQKRREETKNCVKAHHDHTELRN